MIPYTILAAALAATPAPDSRLPPLVGKVGEQRCIEKEVALYKTAPDYLDYPLPTHFTFKSVDVHDAFGNTLNSKGYKVAGNLQALGNGLVFMVSLRGDYTPVLKNYNFAVELQVNDPQSNTTVYSDRLTRCLEANATTDNGYTFFEGIARQLIPPNCQYLRENPVELSKAEPLPKTKSKPKPEVQP